MHKKRKMMHKKMKKNKEEMLHKREEMLHEKSEKIDKADKKMHKMIKKEHMKEKKIKRALKHSDKLGAGAKKRKAIKNPKDKIAIVMEEFSRGKLNSGSGHKVTNPRQALAIGYSEARKSAKRRSRKKE